MVQRPVHTCSIWCVLPNGPSESLYAAAGYSSAGLYIASGNRGGGLFGKERRLDPRRVEDPS